jgi:hypothetical protein
MRTPIVVLVVLAAASVMSSSSAARPDLRPKASSTAADEALPVYGPDARDPWNRIFQQLFTRTVRARLSEELGQGAPFATPADRPFPARVRVSTRLFERFEDGDRAIEALYPGFMTSSGRLAAFREPRRSRLAQALRDALAETTVRPPLDGALMQADLWSAYDALVPLSMADRTPLAESTAASALLPLLARLIKRLALAPAQIAALPDNYSLAAKDGHLPDLFSPDSEWMEVVWFPQRRHDEAADLRRVTRVFVKPNSRPADPQLFLDALPEQAGDPSRFAALALVIQNLALDDGGRVVPTPLTYDVQTRTFHRDGEGHLLKTRLEQHELSRRRLLVSPGTGGFAASADTDPAYVPMAGNDYDFATPQHDDRGESSPVLATLQTRCFTCHGSPNAPAVFTFNMIRAPDAPVPPVTRLRQPNDNLARDVARRKMQRDDFKLLREQWERN